MERIATTCKGYEIEVGDTIKTVDALDPASIRWVTLLSEYQRTSEARSFKTADSFVIIYNNSDVKKA